MNDSARTRAMAVVCSGFALLLAACTRPLWSGESPFPAVPLASRLIDAGAEYDQVASVIWVAAASVAAIAGLLNRRRTARFAMLLAAIAWFAAALLNVHRVQPWAYLAALYWVVLACASDVVALRCLRLLTVGLYFHSAISKLDYSFAHSLGRTLVESVVGARFAAWSDSLQTAGALSLGAAELFVAAALIFRRTQRLGLVGSLAMHLTLLWALGPWGLEHHAAVLLWNVYFCVQNLILWPVRDDSPRGAVASRGDRAASLVAWFAVLWPFTAAWGLIDPWPAWGLYAAFPGRAALYVRLDQLGSLPPTLAVLAPAEDADGDGWVQPPLDAWSFGELNAPIYPGARFQLGVAAAVVRAGLPEGSWQIAELSAADRWTGARRRTVYRTRAELDRRLSEFLVNARPRRGEGKP